MAKRFMLSPNVIIFTFGNSLLNDPINVTIVNTVVMPRAILAGAASFEIQKDNQDKVTINNIGA